MKILKEINVGGKIAVDDTILVKNVESTAGSHILEGFTPLFSAEAVERLEGKGYAIAAKTNVGEFGLDLVGETSYYGAEKNGDRLVLTSSELVKEGTVEAALSVDVNGMPRRAAATSDICFIKPSYGTVSRYGVIACACSGEQIGVSAKTPSKCAEILSVISGHDDKDGTSLRNENYNYTANTDVKAKKVCIIKELIENVSENVKAKILNTAKKLEALGLTVEEISFPEISLSNTAWQILMSAETCNNLSKFDGVKYGYRTQNFKNIDDIYIGTRTEGFGFNTKAIILYGSDVLSKGRYENCYDKAMRVRRIISEKLQEIFKSYDIILCPVMSKEYFSEYDLKDTFAVCFEENLYTALANLTGIPAMVSGGVQLMANAFDESTLLSVATKLLSEVK